MKRAQRRTAARRDPHAGHTACWHFAGAPFGIVIAEGVTIGAQAQFCCWCGPVRLLLAIDQPGGDDEQHGPYIVFTGAPEPVRPKLAVASGRVLH